MDSALCRNPRSAPSQERCGSAKSSVIAYVRAPLRVPQKKSSAIVQRTDCEQQQKYIPAKSAACAILRLRMDFAANVPAAATKMWKLVLTYDGTDFFGWQVQPGLKTIQGELADALERICGERTLPQGSGRTDAGVHALAQVASVTLQAPIPPASLVRALNRALPPAIRILSAEHAEEGFHARHSTIGKRYEYRIYRGEICPPTLARYVYALSWPLDIDAMHQTAPLLRGTHDFTSFAASDPDRTARVADAEVENVRTLTHSAWCEEGDLLVYTVEGNGFLHHMVRNLVGTFLEIGRGQRNAADLSAIIAARSRSAAGATAPARGLFLHSVRYAARDNGDATLD